MKKIYKKIEFDCGKSFEECVLELVTYQANGEFVSGEFNGHILYSDTVSMDSASLEVSGSTYFENLNEREMRRQKLLKKEEDHKKKIPQLTKDWIEKGHQILAEKYWNEWDKCVPIRLDDLYKGMELKCCLEIIKSLNNGCKLDTAKEIIKGQQHSYMSFNLVRLMVKTFCDRGQEFDEYVS